MGVRERKERERAEMRRRILAAARDLFEERGYDGTTMRAIADRMDYSTTILYEHFDGKEELMSAVVAEDFRSLTRGLVETGQVEDPVVRLVRAMEEYVEFALDHPRHYELTFMSGNRLRDREERMGRKAAIDGEPTEVGPTSAPGDAGRKIYAYLQLTCEEAIALGRFRREFRDADEVAQMLWSAMHGAVSLPLARRDDPRIPWSDVRRTALRTCATLIRGLSPPKG